MEFLFKKCLLESYTAEQYNEMALEMFPLILSELEDQFGNLDNIDLPILDLLNSLICLTGHSISRMTNLHTAGLVSNKLEMRDKILLEFDHPAKTKNILRGSGFLSDNAFGPLPESLKSALASINGKEIMCRAKTGPTGTNVQTTTRGGYNNRGLNNQFFLQRGIRRQYASAQALRKARNPNQDSYRGGNGGNERGRGFRRTYGSK